MSAGTFSAKLERVEPRGESYIHMHEHAWYKVGTDRIGATVMQCVLCPDVAVDSGSWPVCESVGPNGERCEFPALGDHTTCARGGSTWPRVVDRSAS